MPGFKNSDIFNHLLQALIVVAGRRTLDSFAIQVIKIIIKQLEYEYDFLKNIDIKDEVYSEGRSVVAIAPEINSVDSSKIGEVIEIIIRAAYLELEDEAGLYFINELKEYLGEDYVMDIRNRGVDLERIQSEQHELYNLKDRKKSLTDVETEGEVKKAGLPDYTWDTVSTWKYENNVCLLYDSDDKLLDTLYLDIIVEDYVRRAKEFRESSPTTSTMFKINEKEEEFLEMLYSRDMDTELALGLLHVSRQKLDAMIHKLLEFEMLQYISDNEVKITEKGINYLLEKKEGDSE